MTDPVAELDRMLVVRSEPVAQTLQALAAVVRRAAPEACELLFANYIVGSLFTFTGKMGGAFCHCVAYENHVNLGFNRGVELEDPTQLLEGTGKLIRHVRIDKLATLKKPAVKALIRQAIAQGIEIAAQRGGVVPQQVVLPKKAKADAKKAPAKKALASKAPGKKRTR